MNVTKRATRMACLTGILTFAALATAVTLQWRPLAAEPPARGLGPGLPTAQGVRLHPLANPPPICDFRGAARFPPRPNTNAPSHHFEGQFMMMFPHGRRLAPVLAVSSALLASAWGCGEGKPSVATSTAEGTVKGTVTIKGKPATRGEVIFDAANYQRKNVAAKSAPIGKDGAYSISTLVGENRVVVSSPDMPKGRVATQEYNLDVKAGENSFNIDVKAAP